MLNKKATHFNLFLTSAILGSTLFSSQVFAQYSTINPASAEQSSVIGKVKENTETFLYNLKPKFKSTNLLSFDDFRIKLSTGQNNPEDVSVSYLTTNGSQSICNIKLVVQDDGRIFNSAPANTPATLAQSLNMTPGEIQSLNNFKLSSLLLGCGLDYQSSPFGNSTQEKSFAKINEIYKNGQVFSKSITINNENSQPVTINATFPSFYLLYRNNYADLMAASLIYKNEGKVKNSSLFGKYHTINKLQGLNLRQAKGIAQWESFNSYDIAIKDGLFNDIKGMSDKKLEDKIKNIAHESVMTTYLLGQREQTESIMDVQTIKQAAIIRTIQELDKDFNIRTTETNFNKTQGSTNNLALKLSKSTTEYMKNTLGSVTGYNSRTSSSNPANIKIIVEYIDKLISKQNLDKVASVEYDNMRKQYPENIQSTLSKVNTVGFFTHKTEPLQNVYQNIYNEMVNYSK